MKILAVLFLLVLSACSLVKDFNTYENPLTLVYEDQYIVEAKGAWCPWSPGVTSCPKVYPPEAFVSVKGEFQPLQLVTSTDILHTTSTPTIVPYDSSKDLCEKVNKEDFNCSPNYVLQAKHDCDQEMIVTPNDKYFSSLWGLNTPYGAHGPKAWHIKKWSENVVVAVLDSGIDVTHTDLRDNIWMTYNAITGSTDIRDGNGHGTHVAGTACATGNNGIGVTGVTWKCKLFGIKFLGDNGSGSLFDAVKGVERVIQVARENPTLRFVINASFGGGGYSTSMNNALLRANEAGIVFVAAAGNESNNNDTRPSYPGSYNQPNVISVAALTKEGTLAYFSNYGKESVDLAAPGYNILSTYPGSTYRSLSGTSMAAPHVAGATALLLSYLPTLTTTQVKERLLRFGLPVSALTGKIASEKTLNLFQSLNGR